MFNKYFGTFKWMMGNREFKPRRSDFGKEEIAKHNYDLCVRRSVQWAI